MRNGVLNTRDIKKENTNLLIYGFPCFQLSHECFFVVKKTEDSIKESEVRVAEIADDSNKTNFLRELAIETKKNLQTDAAPARVSRGRIMK